MAENYNLEIIAMSEAVFKAEFLITQFKLATGRR